MEGTCGCGCGRGRGRGRGHDVVDSLYCGSKDCRDATNAVNVSGHGVAHGVGHGVGSATRAGHAGHAGRMIRRGLLRVSYGRET